MSRFIDQVKVYLKAGDGGRGCVAFRREKFVPRGGPSGGDGGNGGSVVFVADPGMNTLYDFHYRPHLRAKNGRPGLGDKMSGKKGDDLIVLLPPGTTVREVETGELVADLVTEGQQVVVGRGGRGGRGNQHFATATNRAPRRYEEGTPGEERTVELELRSIADVGLVGFPNAGKSTLLRAISNATPEVAAYPFTTLTPHLGVVERGSEKIVVADIPGLIEGASEGKGLGHEFLRHIERTSVLLYVVDAEGFEQMEVRDAVSDFAAVRREVMAYSESMKQKQSLIAVNKIDLVRSEGRLSEIKEELQRLADVPVLLISAQAKAGLDELIGELFRVVVSNKAGIAVT
ncbi:MAG: GTPase ObgE [Bacillota bacterium]